MQVRQILVPVDFSDSAQAALQWAAELAERYGAKLEMLHVYPVPGYVLPDGFVMASPEAHRDVDARARARLQQWLEMAGRNRTITIGCATACGQPAAEILRRADDVHADLIVMGAHGLSGLALFLMGSNTDRVVRHAKVPVLVVPRGM
ncbi:MAG: universal stress protein [Deltaproteobacteria bacterium]|nr:universal stress protein [Deltaproteobacteria bacterium]